MNTSARERIVVVGADAAGMSAAHQAMRSAQAAGAQIDVVVLEKTFDTSYSACGIPYLVAGLVESPDDLTARTAAEHRAQGIDLRMGVTATGLDLATRHVETDGAGRVPFDKLVLATGAAPRIPQWALDSESSCSDGVQPVEDPRRRPLLARSRRAGRPGRRAQGGRRRWRLHRPRDGRGHDRPRLSHHARDPTRRDGHTGPRDARAHPGRAAERPASTSSPATPSTARTHSTVTSTRSPPTTAPPIRPTSSSSGSACGPPATWGRRPACRSVHTAATSPTPNNTSATASGPPVTAARCSIGCAANPCSPRSAPTRTSRAATAATTCSAITGPLPEFSAPPSPASAPPTYTSRSRAPGSVRNRRARPASMPSRSSPKAARRVATCPNTPPSP